MAMLVAVGMGTVVTVLVFEMLTMMVEVQVVVRPLIVVGLTVMIM